METNLLNWLKTYLQRPFPRSLQEFKRAMNSYAQFGEDLLAKELLGYERSDIFCIDIGAFILSASQTRTFSIL